MIGDHTFKTIGLVGGVELEIRHTKGKFPQIVFRVSKEDLEDLERIHCVHKGAVSYTLVVVTGVVFVILALSAGGDIFSNLSSVIPVILAILALLLSLYMKLRIIGYFEQEIRRQVLKREEYDRLHFFLTREEKFGLEGENAPFVILAKE